MHFCKSCNYRTPYKQNYNRHLKSKKHISNNDLMVTDGNRMVTENRKNGNQKVTDGNRKVTEWICEHCGKEFKQRQGLYRHKNKRCKKNPVIQNITNITNNITNNNTTNNNLNIILNIGSSEEIEKIKSLITPEVILKLCEPKRSGIPRQTYDMIKNISNYSLQLKQENKELQNFKKTNARDNLIDVYDENWNKEYFGKYILKDIQKYADIILKKCEQKAVQPDISRDEKLEIIKEVCKNYEKYKRYDEDDLDGIIKFTLEAIDDQIKEHRILHYNITTNNNTRVSEEEKKDNKT